MATNELDSLEQREVGHDDLSEYTYIEVYPYRLATNMNAYPNSLNTSASFLLAF